MENHQKMIDLVYQNIDVYTMEFCRFCLLKYLSVYKSVLSVSLSMEQETVICAGNPHSKQTVPFTSVVAFSRSIGES